MDRFISSAPKQALTLMYHEVISESLCNPDGSAPRGSDLYKLSEREFAAHVAAIRSAIGSTPVGRVDEPAAGARPVYLTFDDGEESAYTQVADRLEAYGWRGHFFIITDFIGRRGFLSVEQIRELDRRGHAIGTHTCSHPVPMSHCSPERIAREWRDSTAILSDLLGHAVLTGSVPGGYYTPEVGRAAIAAGVRFLFNSEPRAAVGWLDDCAVLGRYAIRRGMEPEAAAAFASGRLGPRWRQAFAWNARKVLKRVNARAYVRVRQALLGS